MVYAMILKLYWVQILALVFIAVLNKFFLSLGFLIYKIVWRGYYK